VKKSVLVHDSPPHPACRTLPCTRVPLTDLESLLWVWCDPCPLWSQVACKLTPTPSSFPPHSHLPHRWFPNPIMCPPKTTSRPRLHTVGYRTICLVIPHGRFPTKFSPSLLLFEPIRRPLKGFLILLSKGKLPSLNLAKIDMVEERLNIKTSVCVHTKIKEMTTKQYQMQLSKPRASNTVLTRQISECIYGNKSPLGKFPSNSRIRCTISPDYWYMCPPVDFSHYSTAGNLRCLLEQRIKITFQLF
jgi:hypothetical protein